MKPDLENIYALDQILDESLNKLREELRDGYLIIDESGEFTDLKKQDILFWLKSADKSAIRIREMIDSLKKEFDDDIDETATEPTVSE